jgi:hypothetical protein
MPVEQGPRMAAPAPAPPTLVLEDNAWVVRVENERGKVQEYRCATEQQARALALVLASSADRRN